MSETDVATAPRAVAWWVLALMIAAILVGGGAVAAGRVAAEAAYDAAEQTYNAAFRRMMVEDYARMEADARASALRSSSAKDSRASATQLAELRGQAAHLSSEQAGFVRAARAADVRRGRAQRWRDALTAMAAALAAATGLVGVAARVRSAQWRRQAPSRSARGAVSDKIDGSSAADSGSSSRRT